MPNKMDMATTEIRALETSSRTPIIAVTAGILAGEKINVLNQEWMIIWLNHDLERILSTWLKINLFWDCFSFPFFFFFSLLLF
jgi:hypothetical protein